VVGEKDAHLEMSLNHSGWPPARQETLRRAAAMRECPVMERAEIVVVGGGLIGCAVARELARDGARVALFERRRIGSEASGAAAGMLGVQGETESEDLLRLGAASRALYDDVLPALAEESGRSVEFWRQGTLYLCFTAEDEERLEARRRWQGEAGFGSELLSAERVLKREPALSRRLRCAGLFRRDARLDNVALTLAYAEAAAAAGCSVREGAEVRAIAVERGRVTGVEVDGGRIACDVVVNAAGAWAGRFALATAVPVVPVRGQIGVLLARRAPFRHAIYSGRGYAVSRRDGRVLLGSTREPVGFDKRVTGGGMRKILRAALELSPALGEMTLHETWAGLRPATPDGLPVIGRDDAVEGYFVAAGHFRNGVLLTPITARLVASLVRGETDRWHQMLRPDRFATKLAGSAVSVAGPG
jgi:glycine oxidase